MTFHFSDKNPSMPVAYSSVNAMHTKMEAIIAGKGEEDSRRIMTAIWEKVQEDDMLMNRFDTQSELHLVNMTAFGKEVSLSDQLFMILKMCQIFKSGTQGYFDITANTSGRDCGGEGYVLDTKRHTIRFLKEGVRLDLGGFAKGYTLERISRVLKEENVSYGFINAGDSSSYGIGTHPFGQYWPVGVEHPYFRGRMMHEFHLKDCALSISGKNRQGKPHIIDPHTGHFVDREEMVAVQGVSPLIAEVLSTALYIAPENLHEKITAEFPDYTVKRIVPLYNGESRIYGK